MLIRLENGAPVEHPVSDYNFRALYPAVSFPRYLKPADVEPFGFGLYEYSQQPELAKYQKMVEGVPVLKDDGTWYQQWDVVEMSAEEKAQADVEQAALMRSFRTNKLTASDWTQIADSGVDASTWQGYRQSLRDLPTQSGFPWEVSWPEPPSV